MKRPAAAAAALLAFGAAGISIAAITLAATVTPFWEGMPLCVATGFLGGLALLLWKPSRTGLVFALAVGFGLGFATYLGMALATLSWWEA